MLIAVAYNFLATRNPETIIAVDKNPIARGETLTIHVLQPGPIRLKSLRADVFGEELYVPMLRGDPGETRTTVDRRPLGTFKFFSRDDLAVRAGQSFGATITYDIPTDIQPSGKVGHKTTTWRIEVEKRTKRFQLSPFVCHQRHVKTLKCSDERLRSGSSRHRSQNRDDLRGFSRFE